MEQIIIGCLLVVVGFLIFKLFNKITINSDSRYQKKELELMEKQKQYENGLKVLEENIRKTRKKLKKMKPEEAEKFWNNSEDN